jgi:hypothetical protein
MPTKYNYEKEKKKYFVHEVRKKLIFLSFFFSSCKTCAGWSHPNFFIAHRIELTLVQICFADKKEKGD